MAINSNVCGDVKSTKSTGSSDNYSKPFYGNGLKGSNCAAYCSATKYRKKKNSDSKSPYLNGDNVPSMIPSLIEKNFTSKKGSNIVSSFPLAVNIYKANSGEFRHLKSANRKPKKSVLTLPNQPAPLPQTCTVSDMNDSEYFNKDDERKKIKKRNPTTRNRKTKYEFYDMNARYRSQMNTDLDVDLSSSSDLIQSCIDGKRLRKQKLRESKHGDQTVPHDVWAILRNINRFQFRPSPPMSDESFPMPKKRKGRKKRQKDVRVVETEEFAYITSSYDIESKSQRSQSKSSSFDRITVIDKEHEFSQLCKAFERRFSRSNNLPKGTSKQHQIRNQNKAIAYNTNKNSPKHYLKNVIQKFSANQTINNKPLGYEYNEKKLCNNNCGDINGSKLQYNVSSNNTLCNDGDFDDSVDTFSNGFGEDIDQDFIYSGNSGSSNAAGPVKGSRYEGKRGQGSSICRSSDHYKPLEGKAKVDLNRDQNRNRQIKPRSDQKLTQTEIRRRIARMKFPIVVLGQDQLSSNFEVVSAEPLHFNGLKTHIWPFMRQWQNINSNRNVIKDDDTFNAKTDSSLQRKRSNTKTDSGLQKKKYSQPFLNSNKLASNKLELKSTNRGMITQKSVNSDKAATDSKIKDSSGEFKLVKTAKRTISPQKKPTSVYMLKQKMMELLYNNIPNQSLANETKAITKQSDVKTKLISKITYDRDATPVKRGWVKSKEVPRNPINSPVKTSKQGFTSKKPFGKPSWASELIDNVIKKIKNGVYYTHDPSKLINRKREIKVKEVEVQTIATGIDKSNSIMQSISKVTITKKSLGRVNLPGFDDSKLPAIEIQTLNSSEIMVKHCVTNILVHFDITTPLEPILNVPKSMALIPLEGGQRKAYKCKTSIINSMLPAEICTILPKMMSSFSFETSNGLLNPRNSLDKSPTLLSTISEIQTESADTSRQLPFLLHLKMAVKHQELLNGFSFRKTIRKRKFNTPKLSYSKPLEIEMLPILSRNHLLNYSLMDPFHKIMLEKRAKNPFCQKPVNTCVTIQTYSASNSLIAFRRFDLNSFLKRILSNTQRPYEFPHVFNYLFDKNITINLTTINSQGLEDLIRLNIRSMVTDINNIRSLVTGINKRKSTNATENIGIIQRDLFAIEYTELKPPVLNKNSSTESSKGGNTTKKKGYQKLYRKCQSTSNISIRRTTSLSKITNVDVFFQALGLAPELTAVFDKTYCTKIMSSLKEISNWISDINPTQALLVLLLTNKKDTPDLLRFRPVILQGIAVKRITRANELDMEIEVIEREQMNVGRQYEGINYLPASPENQDSLFEELCWIAKTTASDYQTIFDESSRRLLKSLLEKRKKLNPSYLRVMARYVGLGLLKTPRKTTI